PRRGGGPGSLRFGSRAPYERSNPQSEPIEDKIDDRRGVESQRLTDDEAADDRDAERLAQLAALSETEAKRQSAEQGRGRRHHDRTEAHHRGAEDGVTAVHAMLALGLKGEVD